MTTIRTRIRGAATPDGSQSAILPNMGASEAQACLAAIQASMQRAAEHIAAARVAVLELDRRRGWKALGYDSLRACLTDRLGKSQAQVYRTLAAAQIEATLGLPLGSQPEGRIRGLAALRDAPELQRFAWRIVELVAEIEHDGAITGGMVDDAAALVRAHPELAGPHSPPEKASAGGDDLVGIGPETMGGERYDEDVIAAVEELLAAETPDIQAALDLAAQAPLPEVRASLRRKIAAAIQSLRARAQLRAADAAAMAAIDDLLAGITERGGWPEQRERLRAAHDLVAQARLSEAEARAQLRGAVATIAAAAGAAEHVAGFQVTYDQHVDVWRAYEAACDLRLVGSTPAEIMGAVAAAATALAEGWQVRTLYADSGTSSYQLTRPDYGGLVTAEHQHLPSLLNSARQLLAVAERRAGPAAVGEGVPTDGHHVGAALGAMSMAPPARPAYILAMLAQRLAEVTAAQVDACFWDDRAPVAVGFSGPDPDALDGAVMAVLGGTPIPVVVQQLLQAGEPS